MSENKTFSIGGYPTLIKLPVKASWSETEILATLTLEVHEPSYIRDEVKKLCFEACLKLVEKI